MAVDLGVVDQGGVWVRVHMVPLSIECLTLATMGQAKGSSAVGVHMPGTGSI